MYNGTFRPPNDTDLKEAYSTPYDKMNFNNMYRLGIYSSKYLHTMGEKLDDYLAKRPYGSCGEDVSWKLDTNGVLTISGTGAMEDYWNADMTPWYRNQNSIKKVIIEEGVTSIGECAFYGCGNLSSVTIPKGVTSIGWGAFHDCSRLRNIDLPKTVENLGNSVFGNSGLTSVVIPEGITSIGMHVFASCAELTTVTIPKSVKTIDSSAFEECDALNRVYYHGSENQWSKIEMQEEENNTLLYVRVLCSSGTCGKNNTWKITDAGVLTISGKGEMKSDYDLWFTEGSPWSGNERIRTVVIEPGITSIGECAFLGCTSLNNDP